jgi:hypothetical protein
MAAIDHLFSERPEIRKIDDSTNLFRDVREAIAAQAHYVQKLQSQRSGKLARWVFFRHF